MTAPHRDDITALVNILATAEGEEPQPWMAHYAEAILASEWFASRTGKGTRPAPIASERRGY